MEYWVFSENYFVEKDHLSNRGLECFLRMFQSPAILHDHEHPIKDLDLRVLSQNGPIKVGTTLFLIGTNYLNGGAKMSENQFNVQK